MNKTLFFALTIAWGFTACEDDDIRNSDVPSVVLNGFTIQFPNATGIEWEFKTDAFEAEFEIKNSEYKAVVDQEGTILKYKYEIKFDQLPRAIKESIRVKYNKAEIDKIEVLNILENNYYQIEFERNFRNQSVIFEKSGQLTKRVINWEKI